MPRLIDQEGFIGWLVVVGVKFYLFLSHSNNN
jgi:hypothetical protein